MSRSWRQQQKPRITSDDVKFAEFSGVVNTRSRKDIGLKALTVGDNVFISDTKKITRRAGYSAYYSTGNVVAAYGGAGPLYIVDGGTLKHLASPTDVRTIKTGLVGTTYNWDTINGDTYFVNGTDAGIARGDSYLPWRLSVPAISDVTLPVVTAPAAQPVGKLYTEATFRVLATYLTTDGRETAPSEIFSVVAPPLTSAIRVDVTPGYARTNVYCTEPDGVVFRLVASTTGVTVTFNPQRGGREYPTVNTASMPEGISHIAFCKGRCFAGQYLPSARMSAVWISQPFGFHLWNLSKDYLPVAGEIGLLLSNNAGVLIGTTEAIYQYDDKSGELSELASYGVVPGSAGDLDAQDMAYFWTTRGLCRAMPFENLTEKDVSMPPGVRATAAMVYMDGVQQFVTVTQGGGDAFNKRRERT